MHYWADLQSVLQSVHGHRCYDNIAPNAKCQRVLVLALCLVVVVVVVVVTVNYKRPSSRGLSIKRTPSTRHVEIGTVSLPANITCERINEVGQHWPLYQHSRGRAQ